MVYEEFKSILSKLFDNINEVQFNKFIVYKTFLQQENKKHNLSNICDDTNIFVEYFLNSILPYRDYDLNNKKILDIGSGSGIPGIALKIIFPNIKLTILESNQKKINFMKSLSEKLGFANEICFINQRAEEIKKNQIEQFDVVTSRAVANLAILVEISTQYLKIDGLLIEPKSNNYMEEYKKIQATIGDFGLKLLQIDNVETHNHKQINTFIFKKTHKCNDKYPRKWKDIINEWK